MRVFTTNCCRQSVLTLHVINHHLNTFLNPSVFHSEGAFTFKKRVSEPFIGGIPLQAKEHHLSRAFVFFPLNHLSDYWELIDYLNNCSLIYFIHLEIT